jgi:hypothetical protein
MAQMNPSAKTPTASVKGPPSTTVSPTSGVGLTYVATLHPQPDGTATREFLASEVTGIVTYDGDVARPAKPGDIVSIQPNGTIQGRVPGTAGNYECAKIDGFLLIYQPGEGGITDPLAPEYVFSLVRLT